MESNVICLIVGIVFGIIIGAACAFMLSMQRIVSLRKELRKSASLDEKFKDSFKVLAAEILEEKQKKLKEENKENLGEILKPFESDIKEFKEK